MLEIKDVHKTFNPNTINEKKALNGLNLTLRYIGRVFQDPMNGTAADMQIVENLALASRRGKHRGLASGVSRKEKEEYKKTLAHLDLGLETRLTSKVGLLSGGQRQAITLLMATLKKPKLLLLDTRLRLTRKQQKKCLSLRSRLLPKII